MRCMLLSGGGGLRLWPLSRRNHPKQFLKVDDDERTLFESALMRNLEVCDAVTVITNRKYRYMTEHYLNRFPDRAIDVIYEPSARNTAPAITVASLLCDPDEICLVAPTDAMIEGADAYADALDEAREMARLGSIVMFGIRPTSPHTGYGYIHHADRNVLGFKEKPDRKTAERYLEAGDYLWNSGMFVFKASTMLDEMEAYRPDILEACKAVVSGISDDDRIVEGSMSAVSLDPQAVAGVPEESIDYAVIEQTPHVKVVPARFAWSDVGNLEVLAGLEPPDGQGNRIDGGNVIENGCRNTSIRNDAADMLVVANELDDVLVTLTDDALYLARHGTSDAIKGIIGEHEQDFGRFFDDGLRTYRPWGYYEVLVDAPRYKVKRIVVFPGRRLSLQRHRRRSEHWTVACGTATITRGAETRQVAVNESAYIPIGEAHRVANDTKEALEIIEVSIGEHITEDDIERIDDDYGR